MIGVALQACGWLPDEARLKEEGKVGLQGLHHFMLNDADEAEIEAANINIKHILWLLHCVNVFFNVLVLNFGFCQLLDVVMLELLANG